MAKLIALKGEERHVHNQAVIEQAAIKRDKAHKSKNYYLGKGQVNERQRLIANHEKLEKKQSSRRRTQRLIEKNKQALKKPKDPKVVVVTNLRIATRLAASKSAAEKFGHLPCITPATQIAAAYIGRCEICDHVARDPGELHMDHCHTTGEFRGWLCRKCNVGIAQFNDNVATLQRAIDYLS